MPDALERRRKNPAIKSEIADWYLSMPPKTAEEEFYISAFFELSTCRERGMGTGPIPWTAVDAWAERHGLAEDGFVYGLFVRVMTEMDVEYLDWRSAEDERRAAEAEAKRKADAARRGASSGGWGKGRRKMGRGSR